MYKRLMKEFIRTKKIRDGAGVSFLTLINANMSGK